jgi:tetratricopeptide (TPR) repeat protein
MPGQSVSSLSVPLIIFITYLACIFFVFSKRIQTGYYRENKFKFWHELSIYSIVVFGTFFSSIFFLILLLQTGMDFSGTFLYCISVMILLMLCVSIISFFSIPEQAVNCRKERIPVYGVAIILVISAIYTTNISPVRADIYYKTGKVFEADKQWDAAIEMYNRAIHIAPDQDYYYPEIIRAVYGKINEAGQWSEKNSLFEKAIALTDHALSVNPLNPDHMMNIGTLYWKWAEIYHIGQSRSEKFEKAHYYYEKASKASPAKAIIPTGWARIYLMQGDPDKALLKLNDSLALDDRLPDTYLVMGDIYAYQGKVDESIKSYQRVIQLMPENAEAYNSLGNIYYKQGRFEDAIQANLKAVEINPRMIRAYSLLGLIYLEQGKIGEALKTNLKILQIQPKSIITHRNMAMIYERSGHLNEAIRHMEIVVGLSPEKEKPAQLYILEQLRIKQR